jgi:hypothetical protein
VSEDRLDEQILESAQDYNRPPPTPRDRMWARIDAARTGQRPTTRPPFWQSRRFLWPMAAAAALILGFLFGRITQGPESMPSPSGHGPQAPIATDRELAAHITSGPAVSERTSAEPAVFRRAASPVLNQAEMLLTQFRAGDEPPDNGESFAARAVNLLAETRLLLDSPAAQDRHFHRLLDDLELVLAQIVRYQAAQESETEAREWIAQGLAQRSLLPRLRAQIPAGTTVAYHTGGTR